MNKKKMLELGIAALIFFMSFSTVVATELGNIKGETPFTGKPHIIDQGTVTDFPYVIDYRFYSDNSIILDVWLHVCDEPWLHVFIGEFYFDDDISSCSSGIFYLNILMENIEPSIDINKT